MGSLEKLNDAVKLTENKKDRVEKAMCSLMVEWKNLQQVDSSTQCLLQDCFTDIQSRQNRLNSVEESVTNRNKVLEESTKSLRKRLEEVESKEKAFMLMYAEKSKELDLRMKKLNFFIGSIERGMKDVDFREQKIDEKKILIEEVFEKFCLERNEFERIKVLMEERFEEVKLKEKNVEVRRSELDRVLIEKEKELEAKEKELELKEKSIKNREIKLDRVAVEFDMKMKHVIEKEKELEFKEKSIEHRDIELDGALLEFDLIKRNVDKKEIELEVKEKSNENRKIRLDRVLVEFDEKMKNVLEKEKELELKEKELVSIQNLNEEKSKEIGSRVESNNVKLLTQGLFREFNFQKEELDLEKKVVEKRVKELEIKERYFKEWVENIDVKEKEIDLKNVSSEKRFKELEIREKKLVDQLKEFDLKEKHFKEWVKTIGMKENEIDSIRILYEERCKKLDLMEKNLHDLWIELNTKEQNLENHVKHFETKEKKVDSIRISCEERSRKLEVEKKTLEDQMKELEVKKKQFSNVNHSIVKPEPWSDDDSYADIKFSITMDGKNLLLYVINHKRDLALMTDEIFKALSLSMYPAKLVLDAMQDFYPKKDHKEFEEDVVCRSCILLLEQLKRISPRIQSQVKKAALELASEWKGRMKSSQEVIVFLQLLASYGLGHAFEPEEFLSLFEVIGHQIQISELFQLLGYKDKISDLIEVMLKEQHHVKAVRYVCAFGLRDKFQPASLLKDFFKIALKGSRTLHGSIISSVNKKDKPIDNIVASLQEALACIFYYKLESEYPPDCIEILIQQLVEQKEDEKVRLSASNNDAVKQQDTQINCKTTKSSTDPNETCTTGLDHEADGPVLGAEGAMAVILADMDGKSLQLFLNKNSEDHELIRRCVFDGLKLSTESAKLVLDAVQGFNPPHLEMGDSHYKSPVIMRSCILLLEQLLKLSPEIMPQVKEDAVKLALDWKAKMRTPYQILGFLHLITAYGLNSNFNPTELEKLFENVSYLQHAPQLCRVILFSEKCLNHTMTSSNNCHWHHKNSSGIKIQEIRNNKATIFLSVSPAKLVLDAMQNCYYSNLNNSTSLKTFVVDNFIILVEKLLQNPQQIQPHVKEEALKFALDWKTRLVGGRSKNPTEVFGLFHLLALYQVVSSVDSNELLGLLDSIYLRKKTPNIVRLLGLEHIIPDFIKGLMKKDRLQAIRYIHEFKLVGKFRPVSILKDHICFKKLLASKICGKKTSNEPQSKAISKQLASLRAAVKCITDYQLEVQYPPEKLLAQIQQLEEQSKENTKKTDLPKKLRKRRHAAASDLGPEAQTQWHNKKHPRIEPLVETSLNVPPPAFHSMTNVIGCGGGLHAEKR